MGWVSGGGGGGGAGGGGGGTDPLSDMPLSLRQLSRRMRDGLGGGEGRFPLSGRTGAEVARCVGGRVGGDWAVSCDRSPHGQAGWGPRGASRCRGARGRRWPGG